MAKELESKINRLIGKLNTVEELARIERKAGDRKRLIHKRDHDAEVDRAWSAVKDLKPGDIVVGDDTWQLWCFDEDDRGRQDVVRAGEEWVVWYVQPRKRWIWLLHVNAWTEGITYAVELATHVDRLASAYQRRQLGDPALRAAWEHARKKSIGFDVQGCRKSKFRKIEAHESFGAGSVDRESEQA